MLSHYQTILRIGLAAAMGGAIGFERERLFWAAGLRTHMLVSVGACLIAIVSAYGFTDVLQAQRVVLDPSRIAAQVVSGIGFLGAGTILLRGEVIKGLTTAASLWTVAAVGLACGTGMTLAAGATTIIVLVILAGVKPLEDRLRLRAGAQVILVNATKGAFTLAEMQKAAGGYASKVQVFSIQPSAEGAIEEGAVTFGRLPPAIVQQLAGKIRVLPGVISADVQVPKADA